MHMYVDMYMNTYVICAYVHIYLFVYIRRYVHKWCKHKNDYTFQALVIPFIANCKRYQQLIVDVYGLCRTLLHTSVCIITLWLTFLFALFMLL